MANLPIEIDDCGLPEAVYEYDAEWQPEERDTGTRAGWNITGEIVSARIGRLTLTRDQLVLALTDDDTDGESVLAIYEERAAEKAEEAEGEAVQAYHDDRGDWLYEQRREAGWAAE